MGGEAKPESSCGRPAGPWSDRRSTNLLGATGSRRRSDTDQSRLRIKAFPEGRWQRKPVHRLSWPQAVTAPVLWLTKRNSVYYPTKFQGPNCVLILSEKNRPRGASGWNALDRGTCSAGGGVCAPAISARSSGRDGLPAYRCRASLQGELRKGADRLPPLLQILHSHRGED